MLADTLQKSIKHQRTDFTLSDIKDRVEDSSLQVHPPYQRDFTLDKKKASKLVESVLMGIPIPSIVLHERSEDGLLLDVIDGQNRIMSFVTFMRNEFALEGLKGLPELNGKKFCALSDSHKMILRRKFHLKATIVQNDQPDIQYEIFARLNKGSVCLNPQELRNCIYHGAMNEMLKSVVQDKRVQRLFISANKRYAHEERVLRFFALRECAEDGDFKTYGGSMGRQLTKYIEEHASDDPVVVAKMKKLFLGTIELVLQILGENAFKCISDTVESFSGSIYDSIVVPFSFYPSAQMMAHADEIREYVQGLRKNNLYLACSTNTNTGNTKYTATRINLVRVGLDKIMGKDNPDDFNRYFRKDIRDSVKLDLFQPGCRCPYCKQEILDPQDAELDHIIPYSKGGKTVLENIQLMHRGCNQRKSDKIM